jgi:hypothetical protein
MDGKKEISCGFQSAARLEGGSVNTVERSFIVIIACCVVDNGPLIKRNISIDENERRMKM